MNEPPPRPEATPVERLGRSRARLRSAWIEPQGPSRRGRAGAFAPRDATGASPDGDGLVDLLVSMLLGWWRQHPLRKAADVASELAEPAARALLAPTAARHPLRLVALAAGAGALLVALRPWRWLPQAALSSALLSTLWPHGGLTRWLGSGELGRLLAELLATRAPDGSQDAATGDGAAVAPDTPPAAPPVAHAPAAAPADTTRH